MVREHLTVVCEFAFQYLVRKVMSPLHKYGVEAYRHANASVGVVSSIAMRKPPHRNQAFG